SIVPGDFQRAPGLHRVPGAVGDDGDGGVADLVNEGYAWHLLGGARVEAGDFAADGFGADEYGVLHVGNAEVNAVDSFPVHLRRRVEARAWLANDLVVAGFELWIVGDRELAGGVGQIAIAQLATRGCVNHKTVLSFTTITRNIPLLCCGADQHLSGLCSGFA